MSSGITELSVAQRSTDPYLHIEPCFLNIGKCMKVFGSLFREYYMKHTIKESTDYAAIFNQHLLVTFVMDAAAEREARTLCEALAEPKPGELVCSIVDLAGTRDVLDKEWSRNRVMLPYPHRNDVFANFYNNNFMSQPEREAMAQPQRLGMVGQIMAIKDDYIVVEPMILGIPSFDHYRNEQNLEHLNPLANRWFETLPGDFDALAAVAGLPAPEPDDCQAALGRLGPSTVREGLRVVLGGTVGDAGGDIELFEATLGDTTRGVAVLFTEGFGALDAAALVGDDNAVARLAATPATVLAIQHCGPVEEAVRQALGAFAVAPHAPRRFCLIDGADTYRILKTAKKL